MTIASDSFRTITVKINDISQQLPYIVVNQADDNGKIIRFVPLDHGQKVTGFTGARLYYPPRSDNEYGDYVTGVESDGAWDFPYLDLKESTSVPMGLSGRLPSGSVNPEAVTLRTNAFRVSSSDGHPNEKAHAYRSTYIENFLRSL